LVAIKIKKVFLLYDYRNMLLYLLKINIKKHGKKYLDGAPKPAGLGADGDGLCLKN